MSLTTVFQAHIILPRLFGIILLSLLYFNYFFVAESVRIFLEISSLTGKVLVNKFFAIWDCTLEVVKLTYIIFEILYEDLLIFLRDAAEKFTFAIYLLKEVYLFLTEIGWSLIINAFEIVKVFFNFLEFTYYLIGTFKQWICLTGSTIWCVLTHLPGMLVSNFNALADFIAHTIIELTFSIYKLQEKISHYMDKVYSFLFDIPLDSVYGLLIGAVLVTVLRIKFKSICRLLISVIMELYRRVISLGINLWSGRFLEHDNSKYVDYDFQNHERLCVVCQYHLKEIILFPCKHLCLCSDCCKLLVTNQPMCPICRSDINETFKVYM